jgi:UDP-N-acetylglucosamine transferase subunit ALG13
MAVLLVAASGGHLAQLDRLARRIPGFDDDAIWVTFDGPQSRSLLEHRNCLFVPYTGPRDARTALRNTAAATRIIRATKPSLVVSTGSAIAVSFLPVARLAGIPTAYIESAARSQGPSLTGRILRRLPSVQLFSQYREWAIDPWRYAGSVFDDFAVVPGPVATPPRRILVTLGTIPYGFRRLIERVVAVIPPASEVVWQVGVTNTRGLDINARPSLTARDLDNEIRLADVVIAHAGIGSTLAAFDAGKCPILVPREAVHHEHVDNHQSQIATALAAMNLVVHKTVDALTPDDLGTAMQRRIVSAPHSTPLPILV